MFHFCYNASHRAHRRHDSPMRPRPCLRRAAGTHTQAGTRRASYECKNALPAGRHAGLCANRLQAKLLQTCAGTGC